MGVDVVAASVAALLGVVVAAATFPLAANVL
jgi:hypothetical protein